MSTMHKTLSFNAVTDDKDAALASAIGTLNRVWIVHESSARQVYPGIQSIRVRVQGPQHELTTRAPVIATMIRELGCPVDTLRMI